MSEWISVNDKLPDHLETVIVNFGYVQKEVGIAYYSENREKWYHPSNKKIKNATITHWQPLPKPPQNQPMTETRLVAKSMQSDTYFEAIRDVLDYLDQDGNGKGGLRKRVAEIETEKDDTYE